MMNRIIKEEWLQILILLIPFVTIAIVWNKLPETIPTHWNFKGEANGYDSKEIGIFILPVVNVVIAVLLGLLVKIDPKVAKSPISFSALKKVRLVITTFLLLLFFVTTMAALGKSVDMAVLPTYGIMILFLVLGNYLPKIRSNYFIGIRTPWTLEDPENWRLTHQFAGPLWVIASAVAIALQLILPKSLSHLLFIVYLVVIILPPIIYSFLLFQRAKPKASN